MSGQTALFSLLRAGLWQREPDDMSPFPLSDAEWLNVYQMAVSQTVAGIVWCGMQYLPDGLLPGDALMVQWVAKVDRIERNNMLLNGVLCQLLQRMAEAGLHPVVLKGQGIASLYTHPLMRECGDIDLYFQSEDEERKAAGLMTQAGCLLQRHSDGSNCYVWQGVQIEHHTRLFDIYNPFLRGWLSSLAGEHGFLSQSLGGGSSQSTSTLLSVPSPVPNLLMLNAHLLKHIMGNGVGLRQFCDMAIAYHILCGSYSPEKLETAYRRAGLQKWSRQLHAFLTGYLGLSLSDLPFADAGAQTSPELLRIVLEGGNFGRHAGAGTKAPQTKWERKLLTARSFWKRRRFSAAYAPKEALWTFVNLIIGNF